MENSVKIRIIRVVLALLVFLAACTHAESDVTVETLAPEDEFVFNIDQVEIMPKVITVPIFVAEVDSEIYGSKNQKKIRKEINKLVKTYYNENLKPEKGKLFNKEGVRIFKLGLSGEIYEVFDIESELNMKESLLAFYINFHYEIAFRENPKLDYLVIDTPAYVPPGYMPYKGDNVKEYR